MERIRNKTQGGNRGNHFGDVKYFGGKVNQRGGNTFVQQKEGRKGRKERRFLPGKRRKNLPTVMNEGRMSKVR